MSHTHGTTTLGFASLLLLSLMPGCFEERPQPMIADESATGESYDSDMSATETTGTSTTTTDETTTTDPTDTETTGPMCTDECDPMLTETCLPGRDATQDCVLSDDGCHDLESTPCGAGEVCVAEHGCVVLARSCAEQLQLQPNAADGPYSVDPDGPGPLEAVEVLCDMSTKGGGWTLIAYNDQTTTFDTFDRDWQGYKYGFGDLASGELGWLGNERIHALTLGGVDLEVRHNHPWTNVYTDFSVGDEASLYQLSVSNTLESMDGGWFVSFHDELPFTTFDSDNDTLQSQNCADSMLAGWWYGACLAVSIASNSDPNSEGSQVYWRPPPPNDAAPLWVEHIGMWIR